MNYNYGIITPNHEYMLLIEGTTDSEVWNLKGRVKMEGFQYTVDHQRFQCSPDSTRLFMSCENGVLLQYDNTEKKRDEHRYYFNSLVVSVQVSDKNNLGKTIVSVATSEEDGDILFYDMQTFDKISSAPKLKKDRDG